MGSDESAKRAKASRRLKATDAAAEFVVTVGGFSVLAAVLGICVYLAWVVIPLFSPGSVGERSTDAFEVGSPARQVFVGPYGNLGVTLHDDASVRVADLASSEPLGIIEHNQGGATPTAIATARNGELLATGYADGSVRLGAITFETSLLPRGSSPDADAIGVGATIDDGRTRFVEIATTLGDAIPLTSGSGAVTRIDHRLDPTGKKTLVAMREDGTVVVASIRVIRPLGGGDPRTQLRQTAFIAETPETVRAVHGTSDGDNVLVVRIDGTLERYSRDGREIVLRERAEMLEGDTRIAAVEMLFGGKTILVADSGGEVQSWHVTLDESNAFGDEAALVRSHMFRVADGPVTDITPSSRDRSVLFLDDTGRVRLRHMTSEKLVFQIDSAVEDATLAAIGPRNDSVLIMNGSGAYERVAYEPGYPGFGFKALFGKVHYEGLSEPTYVYQSSSGSDSAETKLNLMPLIFGTLKATVFAMLFAVPMGVLAAIYSSEFLSKRVRKVIKPTVEMMASLPSVVLGFVAAIAVAPVVSAHLPSFLSGLIVLPLVVLMAAHVWQLAPQSLRRRLRTGHHLTLVLSAIVLGVVCSLAIGPGLESTLFGMDRVDRAVLSGDVEPVPESEVPAYALDGEVTPRDERRLRERGTPYIDGTVVRPVDGEIPETAQTDADFRRWLNSEYGSAANGWLLVLFPVCAIIVWFAQAQLIRRALDERIVSMSAQGSGAVVLAKFLACVVLTALLAFIGSRALASAGIDPRDSIFGPFSPRNTFVVAIIMGFAVIPIIYTIAEDALQSVPGSLRTASLGAGATRWQTATRVVLPVAASGIFSGVMIGFGRAVGETMIVLMATGNTPDISWNMFAGFRTLAANIAVELPEAPKDSTHYRVLFLCGFVLFVMTFVINTSAELVRRWVRSRNAGL